MNVTDPVVVFFFLSSYCKRLLLLKKTLFAIEMTLSFPFRWLFQSETIIKFLSLKIANDDSTAPISTKRSVYITGNVSVCACALTQATNYMAMTLMPFPFTCCNKSLPFYDIYISITKQMRALENGACVFGDEFYDFRCEEIAAWRKVSVCITKVFHYFACFIAIICCPMCHHYK